MKPFDQLSILVVGQTFPESRTAQRIEAMRALGCKVTTLSITPSGANYETRPSVVDRVRYRLRIPGDPARVNAEISRANLEAYDILWVEAAPMIRRATLERVRLKNPGIAVIWYGEDDMMNPRHRSRWLEAAMPYFDLWLTTKSFNARREELPSFGIKRVVFVNNACDPDIHRPVALSAEDRRSYESPVSFIGTYEAPRAHSLVLLAEKGFQVRVWGNGWARLSGKHPNLRIEGRPAYNEEFAKVIAASAINLCFLRKANRDLQTCRSMEIPACGGFMAHEATIEIKEIFRQGKEAVYWEDDEGLVELCDNWLTKDSERKSIGEAARKRLLELDLTHQALVRKAIGSIDEFRGR